MRIEITLEVDPEDADPSDSTGLTESAFNRFMDALSGLGDDVKIQKAE
jgi:hypothetical protein